MKLNKLNLKWKIFIYLLVFTIVLLGLLWLFQIVFLSSFYSYIKINEVKQKVEVLEQYFIDNADVEEFMKYISSLEGMSIELISADNEVIYFPGNEYARPLMLSEQERRIIIEEVRASNVFQMEYTYANTISGRLFTDTPVVVTERATEISRAAESTRKFNLPVMAVTINERGMAQAASVQSGVHARAVSIAAGASRLMDQKWLLYAKTIEDAKGNDNILLVGTMITPIDATVDTLKVQLIYISIFMILISILISFIIAKHVSRPIEKINTSAKNLAQGNYDIDFSCTGYKEIIELSDTLSYATVELSKVEKLRREWIANISHDLRTPLTLISGFAEIMRDIPRENTQENASIIVEETNRLTHIVNDLLDFSKLQDGVQRMELKEYNISKSLFCVVQNLNELIKKDGYRINFTCDGDFFVCSDEEKIKQVFYNLLTNAVNYAGESSVVDVFIEGNGQDVIVKVVDYGEGIAEENLPYIWERYYKIDMVHKRAVAGSGIGLSIVKTTLENCPGAKYGATSQIGVGTTFYFSLKNVVK